MKIYVAGHKGLAGSAIVKRINETTNHSWVGEDRANLDLLDRSKVFNYLEEQQPDAIIIAAARVGGILANRDNPVQFLSENLQIQTNLIDAAHAANISRLIFLGSSCIYPKLAPQPLKESYLLSGPLEETNRAYSIAKIAGIELVDSYRRQYGHKWLSVMPTNLYGPGDNFSFTNSHVLPAMISKFHTAKLEGANSVTLWGSGSPLREFLYSEDLADACLRLLEIDTVDSLLNIGSGREISIRELSSMVASITAYSGTVVWDESKPDGTPRKLLDSSVLTSLGWVPKVTLEAGIAKTYRWLLNQR